MTINNGNDLKRIRLNAGLNTVQMGTVLGVNPQSVVNWENDRASPPKMQLMAYVKLDKRVKEIQASNTGKQKPINKEIMQIIFAGGLIAFMAWLFKDE